MGTTWFVVWCVWILCQTSTAADGSSCEPGFESELFILKVSRKNLKPGTRLGKVGFTDCTTRTRFLFSTDDSRLAVETEGILTVKREVVLHEGNRNFLVHAWDSQGQKMTLPVRLLYQDHHYMNNRLDAEFHHEAHKLSNQLHDHLDSDNNQQIPILDFPKSNPGLKRRKRDWIIPPINIPENSRGPFPRFVAEIRSNKDKVKKIHYSITGPGADQPPVNLFTMNRDTGHLHVTQELDREKVDKYMLQVHSVAEGGDGKAEEPMDVIINIIDQNDNKPVFSLPAYNGEVPEVSQKGFQVIQVVATDADEPNTDNSAIQYRIVSQEPEEPGPSMFTINPNTGVIRVKEVGLDREKVPQYTLEVQAADMKGEGLTGFTKVIIKVTDLNDHAPVFTLSQYTATVEENKVDALVVKMLVTDGDEPHTAAWNAKFKIIDGNKENLFSMKTGTNKQEGIITTAKGLDFERTSKHTLVVSVVNEAPFAPSVSLVTSTATVVVTVEDVNEPLMFDPKEKHVSKSEGLDLNSTVVWYTASDPDTGRKQKVMYKILNDPAGWLDIDKDSGVITVRNQMDRESIFVKEDKYTALIGAYDDDQIQATATGTLVIHLQDVNDNPPTIEERKFTVCSKIPVPQLLTVTDRDGPGFTSPYNVSLVGSVKANWTARMISTTGTGIILTLNSELEIGDYTVTMSIADNQGLSQVSTVTARVCDCTGEDVSCRDKDVGGSNPPVILGILKAIVVLLIMLGLPLFLFVRRRRAEEKPVELKDLNMADDMFEEEERNDREDIQ
ncbi:cadherin-1-like isoform X1 [Poecilia latipinna]|uniref:cadherin-1-like isoform X1 n=1 Tax=Poecilia latipinna TaxID=48699 RepID=UPI00072E3BE0|nr:PREDICTED: cadherin-1-like isoform X1 [Poecilia latipinna]